MHADDRLKEKTKQLRLDKHFQCMQHKNQTQFAKRINRVNLVVEEKLQEMIAENMLQYQ